MKSHASMNRIYRLVWNAALNLWVAVAENAKGRGKSGSARNKAALLMLVPLSALMHQAGAADAANATVSAGTASVATTGNTTTINQTSQRAAIDWTSLSTRANEALVFNQPNAQAIALNRITGSSPSELLGSLTANGQVFILNPNGVLFGARSQVNVGGLVASTLNLSNADFEAGNYKFTGSGAGSVVNQGTLNAAPGGYLALLAPEVRNEGVMTASLGTALLAAGSKVTLNLDNGSLLGYSIDQGAIKALAENKHLIQANGGQVLLSAKAMDSLTTATVNNTGVIEARTVQKKAGRILLMGDMSYGTVNVGGTLDASAPNGGDGGFIETSAAHVKVADSAVITTKTAEGLGGQSGSWLIDPTDFTIAASGGDMTGAALSTQLANNGTVTILNTQGASGTAGDINVNDSVSWSSNSVLTLTAGRNININRAITATGASGGLRLNYGGAYKVNAPITLSGANATLAINGTSYTLIHSMAALDAIDSTGLSGSYALAGDLDAGGTTYTNALVGDSSSTFTGTFAGLGHTISNLTINASGTDYVGLFGYTDTSSVIRDIGLAGGSVSGNNNVGGLVGYNTGNISNAYATGSVSGSSYVGGLVGYNNSGSIINAYATGSVSGSGDVVGGLVGYNNSGSIINAYATGSVSGGYDVGGLVGWNYNNSGSIINAYATGSVSGSYYVGGLVGYNYYGNISTAYATGSVSGSGNNVGGLVGVSDGSISNAYATGSVSGGGHVGGLVGVNNGNISNAYATGSVSGGGYVGGLVGGNDGSINNAYVTGSVSGGGNYVGGLLGYNGGSIRNAYVTGSVSGNGNYVGELVGWNGWNGSIINAYWDSTTTGQSVAVGVDNGTTTNVNAVSSATRHSSYANFGTWSETASGSGVWVATDSSGKAWVLIEGSTRPFLYSEYSTNIHNAHQLQLMALDTSASYTLARNIDASETIGSNAGGMWTTAGFVSVGNRNEAFTGTLDGQGHTVNDLHIASTSDDVGLIGYSTGATVQNIGLQGGSVRGGTFVGSLVGTLTGGSVANAYSTATVSGSGDNVGGLVGLNAAGSVSKAYSTGQVTGSANNVGGLVGSNAYGGTISHAYSSSVVKGVLGVGGLVGESFGIGGSIADAYATGSVSGDYYVGGLVGNNSASISNAYATGSVGVSDGGYYVGGLAGRNSASISNAYATGSVSGNGSSVGGLVGDNYGGSISNAYATGSVSGSGRYVGGLVGYNYYGGSVSNAYATGSVFGSSDYIGGLVGRSSNGSISNAYATGNISGAVSASNYVGGLVGLNDYGSVSNVYATGSIPASGLHVGGLVGMNYYGTVTASFWLNSISSTGIGNGQWGSIVSTTRGLSASEATSASTYTAAGWSAAAVGGSSSVWRIYEGYTAPLLRSFMTATTVAVNGSSGTYNGTDQSVGTTYSAGSGVDTSLISVGSASYVNAGSYSLGANLYSGQQGYDISYTAGTLTIAKAALTVSTSDTSKTYDGSTTASGTALVISGTLYGSDSLSGGSFAYTDKNAGTGKTVSTSGVTVSDGNSGGNYDVSYVDNTNSSITVATLTVSGSTAASKTYDGTTAATVSGSLSGLVSGDTVALSQSGTFSDKNAATGKTVSYTSSLSGTDAGNYVLASSSGSTTADITAATLTVSGTTAANKTYDGTTAATVSGSLTGVISGDTVALSQSGTFSDKNAATGKTVSYTSSVSGTDAGNYVLASSSGSTTADITAATLTVSGTTAANKTYDGTAAATLSGSLSGLISGDTVSLSQSGTFSDKNAATGKTVSYTSSLSGTDASNYVLATSSGSTTADITAATLTVSGTTAANKTYDGTTAATVSGGLSGLISGDTVALSQSGTFSDKNAATGKTVSYTSSLSGTDASNYVLATSSGSTTADITAATLTVSGTTAANKTYDGATAATVSGSLTGLISGDTVALSQSGTFSDKNAATGKTVSYTSSVSGADAGNYVLASSSGSTTADITAATLTVSGTTAANKTYDGTTAATLSGSALSGLISGDTVSLSQSGSFSDKNAATGKTVSYASSLSGTDAGNYVLASSSGSTTADITVATLTISGITAADKTYNASTAAIVNTAGVSYSGLVAGDVVSVNASGVFSDKNVGTGKTVNLTSSYSGADAGNYAITDQATTAASISQATLTVSGITAADKTYDTGTAATVNTAGASYNGLFAGDIVNVAATGLFGDKNAGVGKTVTLSNSYTGADVGNYVITSQAGTTATVNKADLTVQATGASKVYDGTTAATVALSGNGLAGDALSLTGSASFGDRNAGLNKAVSVTGIAVGGADAGNYNLISNSAATTADITPKELTVTANNDAQMGGTPYGGGNGVSYNGLVTGDTAATVLAGSVAYGGSAQGAYLPGEYGIMPGGLLANGNYNLRFIEGRLTLSGGDVASAALGGPALVGAYDASKNMAGDLSGFLLSVEGGGADDEAKRVLLNAAAAEAREGGGE